MQARVALLAFAALLWDACAWTAIEVAIPADADLLRLDTGVFNYSSSLQVLADGLVWPQEAAASIAACGDPRALFRWTPYRLHANWSAPGALAAWAPVDLSARRVAVGLRWWFCRDTASAAHARVWTESSAVDCDTAALPAWARTASSDEATEGLVTTRVCAPGVYVLGAAPCADGAPHGADCIQCAPGRHGCACEFTEGSYHRTDAVTAGVAWTVAVLMALPYAAEAIAALTCDRKRRAYMASGYAEAAVLRNGAARVSGAEARLAFLQPWAHALAASLVLSVAIDTVVVRPGRNVAYAHASLAFACAFVVASLLTLAPGTRAPASCAKRLARTLACDAPYFIGALLWEVYMDARAAYAGTTIAMMALLFVAQIVRALLARTHPAVSGVCAILSFSYVMPTWDAPCAGTANT